ncbi:MAG: hypothetical protein QW668_02965 [Nitrososphaerota archaeon]
MAGMKVIKIREISKDQAEILEYLVKKDEAEAFDIAKDLGLDLT